MINTKRNLIASSLLVLFALFFAAPWSYAQNNQGKEAPVEEIINSRASHLFETRDYEGALKEFQALSAKYPDDPLLRRYVAMTMILVGRLDEAITILQENIAKDPNNPANHYYLARAYHEQGAKDKAKAELDEVLQLDPKGFYSKPTKRAMPIVLRQALAPKRWDIWIASGYEYDTNVSLAPSEKDLRFPGEDISAGRYYMDLGGKYKWYEHGRFDSNVGYHFYKSFHDDGLNEFNYTYNEFFNFNEYRFNFATREVKVGLRYAIAFGYLGGQTFLFKNEVTAYSNTRLTANTFTEIYHRYDHQEFGHDGADSNLTSRDGEYNTSGIHHRYYFSDFKRYIFGGFEFQTDAVKGDIYDRLGFLFQAGLHTPVIGKLDADVVGSFGYSNFPHYSAAFAPQEPLARRDYDWIVFTALTYPLTRHLSLRGYYRFETVLNPNDVYQYKRNIVGGEVIFRY